MQQVLVLGGGASGLAAALAAAAAAGIGAALLYRGTRLRGMAKDPDSGALWACLLPVVLITLYLLHTHVLHLVDGAYHTGQSCYGDMPMHLGFIKYIAQSGEFLPRYPLLGGTHPIRGVSAVRAGELAASLETLLACPGGEFGADQLETLMYNTVDAAFAPDGRGVQPMQQANQAMLSRAARFPLSGDDAGLEALMKKYGDPLTLYIDGYLHDVHEAEELMLDVFAYLFTKKPKIRDGGFKAYLYKAARHMALRHKSKRKPLFSLDMLTGEPDGRLLAEEVIRTEERNRVLHFCMGEMNPDYREVLYLTYFEGMSYAQAAEVTGKTVKQITNMVYRGKESLRRLLEREGITNAES